MILAAGFGVRLQPHTNSLPKALVPFCGKPMINFVIEKMRSYEIEKIVVNTHHYREKLIEYLTENDFGVEILISDEKENHLLTGGGIKNAVKLFGDAKNVLIHNTDIISDLDYGKLVNFHISSKSNATLAIRKKDDERVLVFDDNFELTGWKNKTTNETIERIEAKTANEFGFTGIYILSKEIFNYFPEEDKFDIVKFFLSAPSVLKIKGYVDDGKYWFDLGSEKKIKEAEEYFGCNEK